MTEVKKKREIVTQGKNIKIYSDGTILFADVRVSYPHFDKKWCKNPAKDTPAYTGTIILANDTHAEAIRLAKAFNQTMLDEKNKGGKIKADAQYLRDGDMSGKDEYADAYIVAARESNERPVVLNPDKSEMPLEDVRATFKAGHFVDMLIEPWWQDNEHGKRINASLRAVRYRRDGPLIAEGGVTKDEAISSFDDDDDGGFGGGDDEL